MNSSASLLFPFSYDNENECLSRAETAKDTILSSIKCFLLTKSGSRVGNNIGSILPELLLQTVSVASLPEISEAIKSELVEQFPGVDFLEVLLTQEKSERIVFLRLKVELTTPVLSELLTIQIDLNNERN